MPILDWLSHRAEIYIIFHYPMEENQGHFIHVNNPIIYSLMDDCQICNKTNTAVATSEAGTAYHSGTSEFTAGFVGFVVLNFCFCVVFYRSVLVLLFLFHLAIILLDLFQFTASDYTFGIFKLFLLI